MEWPRPDYQCGNQKVRHPTRKEAAQHRRRLKLKGGEQARDLHVYLCRFCDFWHVGHSFNEERTVDNVKNCPFCAPYMGEVIAQTAQFYVKYDPYPCRPGHKLVIPFRHVESYFDLMPSEATSVQRLIRRVVDRRHDHIIAINDGTAAGRSIDHCHIHLIPCAPGDVAPGGVRGLFFPPGTDPWINREV